MLGFIPIKKIPDICYTIRILASGLMNVFIYFKWCLIQLLQRQLLQR